ncbi:MAG: hypothetical protein PHG90_03725 [Clostridia bacterium]|nr:hypothetical protein [Clostridia bacterium]
MDRVRILSFEANELYDAIDEAKSVEVGENELDHYRIFLEWSLDSEELKRTYEKQFGYDTFSKDVDGDQCTDVVINVSFTYTYKSKGEIVNLNGLRKELYDKGFYVNGVKYVRYKRSSGSSREGNCLFIREELLEHMREWGECGLVLDNNKLAAWESYIALTLSTIIGTINIPIDKILFVEDVTSTFIDKVISIEKDDSGVLSAEEKETEISNNIWDGESLLDESVFTGDYEDKHMLLLRNKFFKSCAFRTNLKGWFKDNGINDVEKLKAIGCVTLARKVEDILMVTTPSSLKYLKFVEGGLTQENIEKWANSVKSEFGVVKFDKRTRYFGGRLVQSNYQMLNTIHLNEKETETFLTPTVEYLKAIKKDSSVLEYHVFESSKGEKINNSSEETEEEEDFEEYGLMRRGQIIFCLYELNRNFARTKLCSGLVNTILKIQKEKAKLGKILLPGTNATIFGNGPELLKRIIGEFDISEPVLKTGQIRCERFNNGEKLLCSRSPHITMGNLYIAENIVDEQRDSIWSYFNLGKNIVCVNAIGDNIQQRLNGCDYDSDAMLITNHSDLLEKVRQYYNVFKVPVCNIKEETTNNSTLNLSDLDSANSQNKVGEIVNLSQILNSLLWDRVNNGRRIEEEMELYKDICILAVLSGIEVDKAKHSYNVNSNKVLGRFRGKYKDEIDKKPLFLEAIMKKKNKRKNEDKSKVTSKSYKTTLEYIFSYLSKLSDMRKGKPKSIEWTTPSELIKDSTINNSQSIAEVAKEIIKKCDEYIITDKALHNELNKSDIEGNCLYAEIRMNTDLLYNEVAEIFARNSTYAEDIMKVVLYLLKQKGKEEKVDWRYYAPLFQKSNNNSIKCLFDPGENQHSIPKIEPYEDGNYATLYGINFKCIKGYSANGSDSTCEDCRIVTCEKKSENKQS